MKTDGGLRRSTTSRRVITTKAADGMLTVMSTVTTVIAVSRGASKDGGQAGNANGADVVLPSVDADVGPAADDRVQPHGHDEVARLWAELGMLRAQLSACRGHSTDVQTGVFRALKEVRGAHAAHTNLHSMEPPPLPPHRCENPR